MSSRIGGGSGAKLPTAGSTESGKGKNVAQVSDRWADQVVDRVSAVSLDSEQDGGWEEVARKPRNRFVGNVGNQNSSTKVSGNPWTGAKGPSNAWTGAKGPSNAWPRTKQPINAWAGKGSTNSFAAPAGDNRRPTGRGWNPSSIEYVNNYDQPAVIPPLEKGWQWCSNPSEVEKVYHVPALNPADATDDKEDEKYVDKSGEEEDFNIEDINDSDEYDSDESQKSHETLKKSTLLKSFFETLDEMKAEEINEPDRQWHCPACHGGPGAIDWYCGLQPLITHAKTKGKRRAKAHRLLAKLLDEELRRRGSSVIPAGEAFGKWKGLNQSEVKDRTIVWPPMVIIMNTQLERDEKGKWIGMGNPELLEYFNNYAAVRSRHSYGPQGHRGMSVLIFEPSAVGYFEAERLSKHFEEQGTNREAWDRRHKLFLPGGQRLLYGYMAQRGDIDKFNQHSQGKSKLKFEMRSYEEMVVNPMKQMNEDNHLLHWYKNEVVKEKKHSKTLEESFGALTEKLGKTLEENRIVRQRTKMHHEQIKEEMDIQEEFYREQLRLINKSSNEREDIFEKIQQEKREKIKIYMENSSSAADRQSRIEQGAMLIFSQQKDMDNFAEERDKLFKDLENRKAKLRKQRYEEDVKLEREFDENLARLMGRYSCNS
ncbi:protein SUPPRESSOR OF GENE SILENCING 3-like [Apium graveolens]|uniref:protein SUPPRESSOR OF GENE SILENCING 3-like n=1 Tax=Apium graveolens TaxID=4045 RepID=UPI003D7962F5